MNRDAQITLPWKHDVELSKEEIDKLGKEIKELGYKGDDITKDWDLV